MSLLCRLPVMPLSGRQLAQVAVRTLSVPPSWPRLKPIWQKRITPVDSITEAGSLLTTQVTKSLAGWLVLLTARRVR